MSDAPPFLCGPLGAFFSPQPVEPWKPAHNAAMACRDLEEAIAVGLELFQLIHEANKRWADAVQAGKAVFSWQTAGQFAAAYRWWLDGAQPVLRAIAQCGSRGFDVEQGQKFRDVYREVSLLPLDMQRAQASGAAAEKGLGVPFDQAMDELQNHLHQRRRVPRAGPGA